MAPAVGGAEAREAFERDLIRETLRMHGRRMAPAARQLGVSRVTLYRIVARLKLDSDLLPGEAESLQEEEGRRDLSALGAPRGSTPPTAGAIAVSDSNHDRIVS